MTRPLTHAEALDSWRVHGELAGSHRSSETIAFVSELQDIADERQERYRYLPAGFVSPDLEPKWRTTLAR